MDNTRRPPATRSTGEMAASTTSPLRALRGGIQRSEAAGAAHQRFGDISAFDMTVDCST